jgi:hypothetical protein
MSYSEKIIYEIIPIGSYKVIKNCAKCGGKSYFVNTNSFRVNANGNKLDVWLIYQCEKCRQTYNLSIYERINRTDIKNGEYEKFISNDIGLSAMYGNNKMLFTKNKAEIDMENVGYQLAVLKEKGIDEVRRIEIRNPYGIKIRTDRVLSEILQLTRNTVKALIKEGRLSGVPAFIAEITEVEYS